LQLKAAVTHQLGQLPFSIRTMTESTQPAPSTCDKNSGSPKKDEGQGGTEYRHKMHEPPGTRGPEIGNVIRSEQKADHLSGSAQLR
jgi:hypothetical protein